MNTCAKCRFFFWERECHRHAPVYIGECQTRWPKVLASDSCGDFEIKPDLRPCMTCAQLVGEIGYLAPHLKHATLYPICKECYEQFTAGTHPFQKPLPCKHEYVNSDRNLKTYTCAQCGTALDENRRVVA